jgi:hypothetical protein
MICEVIIRSALGVLVHTTEDAASTVQAMLAVLSRPEIESRLWPLKHADLTVLCRPVTWAASLPRAEDEGRVAA